MKKYCKWRRKINLFCFKNMLNLNNMMQQQQRNKHNAMKNNKKQRNYKNNWHSLELHAGRTKINFRI